MTRGTGHGARGTGHGARGTGHGARGTGHGARGTGHGARGTGHGARAGQSCESYLKSILKVTRLSSSLWIGETYTAHRRGWPTEETHSKHVFVVF